MAYPGNGGPIPKMLDIKSVSRSYARKSYSCGQLHSGLIHLFDTEALTMR